MRTEQQLLDVSIKINRLSAYGGIGYQLLPEGIQRRELPLVADAAAETDPKRQTVDVLIKIQDVRLKGPCTATHRRPYADVTHSQILPPKHFHINGIHPVVRHQL